MSLDQNLFTLAIAASSEENGALDLTDPNTNTIHYRKRTNAPDAENPYRWGLYDPLSDGLLCTVTAPNATSKQKWIELHNPDAKVEFSFAGTINFKWHFDWEGHTFEWRKDSCYLIRKPDPPVQVAVTREPAGRIKTHQVQLLDYNLNRFDIEDRKGLEIIMLAAMLTFSDYSDALRAPASASSSTNPTPSRHNSDGPPVPTKAPSDIVASLQVMNKAEKNEVIVSEDGSIDDYATHCVHMLKDQSMLYLVIRPQSQEHVAKVLQVAEATKRFHYKSGGHEEELFQYVTMEDIKPEKAAPKIINLDDGSNKKKKNEYKPPQTVTVHLSKIPMPELQPKARPSAKPTPAGSSASSAQDSSSSFRPWKRNNRTPSPSRPPSNPPNPHPQPPSSKYLTKPPPQQQKQQHSSPNPYHYQMALHPQTGPSPTFSNPEKQHKDGKGKDHKNRPPNNSLPSSQSSPYPPPNKPSPYPPANQSSPYSSQPSQSSSYSSPPVSIPGAYPSSNGFSSTTGNANRPPQNAYGGWSGGPPPGPPPSSQSSQQSSSLTGIVTSGIISGGYSLLDKFAGKAGQPPAKH